MGYHYRLSREYILFKTNQGRVLYVGKATKLNQRVKSYFSRNPDRAMIPELVKQSDDIEVIVTASPHEALILERQLIRQHKPRYNSMLKMINHFHIWPYQMMKDRVYCTPEGHQKVLIFGVPFQTLELLSKY